MKTYVKTDVEGSQPSWPAKFDEVRLSTPTFSSSLNMLQLLVTGAALEAPSAFRCLCDSVPRVLWQLADHSRPMLGSYGPLRPAGQTFVEERGAGGTMLQAMLRLAFKIVKVQLEQGCSEAQHDVRSQRGKHGPNGAGADGDGRVAGDADICVGGAWRTPADVITGTFVKRSCGPAGDAGEAQGHQEESDTCIGSHLVRLFCEQDDMLVDMLLTNLHIYRRLCGDQVSSGLPECVNKMNGMLVNINGSLAGRLILCSRRRTVLWIDWEAFRWKCVQGQE